MYKSFRPVRRQGRLTNCRKIDLMRRSFSAGGIGLLLWTGLAWPQRPSEPDAQAAIENSRQKGLDYARSLPDFVCTEVIRRYADRSRSGHWLPTDKLTIKLSYFEQNEQHKLMLIDDKPTDRRYESLDGAIGIGEFGGTLHSIFDPVSESTFHWESWKTVRKHGAAVYSYVVQPSRSHYVLVSATPGGLRKAIVGYHGVLEIDRETGDVLHFTYEADHIPRELLLDYAVTTVDYDLADVGGRDYLLPVRSQSEVHSPRLSARNESEFREYRKFGSDSTITFGAGK
jgi:hypothetical protein